MSSTQAPLPDNPPARKPLPEWPVERFIARLGRRPAALGRLLDRAAQIPIIIGPMVQFFSSVWLGLLWVLLIGIYVGLGSGLVSLRMKWEKTDLQFFNAPPMVALCVLLMLTLTVVTLRRIPLTIYKLGTWIVHTGILVLLIGCFVYFGLKREGSVRIFQNQTVQSYFDNTDRALYLQLADAPNKGIMVPLPGLPMFHEYIAKDGNPLNMTLPNDKVAQLNEKFRDVSIRVTGFYPYAELATGWDAGPADAPAENPAVHLSLSLVGNNASRWLLGRSPRERQFHVGDMDDAPFNIEYLYHPTPQRVADLSRSFSGGTAITVRVPGKQVEETYVAEAGKPIAVAGTPYTITPGDAMAMPLLTKGYEGTFDRGLNLDIVRADGDKPFAFRRMAMFRFPERSQDFVTVEGKSKRIPSADDGIQIIYHDAAKDQFWVIESDDGKLTLLHRAPGGKAASYPMEVGKVTNVSIADASMQFTVDQRTPKAVEVAEPWVVNPVQRQREFIDSMAKSMVELEISRGDWRKDRVIVPFVQFPNARVPNDPPPTRVEIPGVGDAVLTFSRVERPLPSSLTLVDFAAVKYKGAMQTYRDYISTVRVKDLQSGQSQTLIAKLNDPAEDQGLYYFQAAWDGDENAPPERRFTVLGVGNRPGIGLLIAGSVLIVVGIAYAFYAKPLLLAARKKQLAAYAAGA